MKDAAVVRPDREGGLMKTGTGSAILCCIDATAQPLLVAVPVPLFISRLGPASSAFQRVNISTSLTVLGGVQHDP